MAESPLRLVKALLEFIPVTEIDRLRSDIRGLYVLYNVIEFKKADWPKVADVVYVGLSKTDVRGRLRSHRKQKAGEWTHVSVFAVWENVRDQEIVELEGLFRHIYRKDRHANALNDAGAYLILKTLPRDLMKAAKAASAQA